MENKNIYVEIESSNFIRKDILESAADSLRLLKELEEDIDLFMEEEDLFKKFRNKMTHVRTTITKLDKVLPVIEGGELHKKVIKKKNIVPKKAEPKSEVDILKDEIDNIERKLRTL